MLILLRPQRVIEIGSGHSSALMLDVNEYFLDRSMQLTFIEPYPELLLSLMDKKDEGSYRLLAENLSTIENHVFESLEANDILFVDSTHVSKTGSDVNQIFLEILPRLKKGVYVHVHDIFYPFEYPQLWVEEGRAWTEGYLLRAFLCNNKDWEIVFFNNFMNVHHQEKLSDAIPISEKNAGGGIWLRKIR